MMAKLKEPVILVLQRGLETAAGTKGVIQCEGKTLCYTVEEKWRNNAPADYKGETESCIIPGMYKVVRHGWEQDAKTHFKRVWRLLDVPGRDGVLIHYGNTTIDTEGCILVGMVPLNGGVGRSMDAINMLRDILPETFMLEIRGYQS